MSLGLYRWIGARSMLVSGRSRADVCRSRVSIMDGGDRSMVEGLVMGVEKVRWFGLGLWLWLGFQW